MRGRSASLFAFAVATAILALQNTSVHAATLVYTNDVLGELEPCGCRNNPTGGLPRKGVLLDQSKDQQLLQLDGGDLLFETNVIPPALAAQRLLQAERLAKAHVELGHDAVVPGEKDFALGVKTFNQIRKKSGLRFLAANLMLENGTAFLEPSVIFKRKRADGKGTLTIGVFGLVGSDLRFPSELRVTSPLNAAREQVQAMKAKKVDRIIALTHQGYEADLALAKSIPAIDIIVGGHTQTFLQQPVQQGHTTILQSSFRNQYVGLAPLDGPITAENHRLPPLDESLEPSKNPSSARGKKMELRVREWKEAVAKLNEREAITLKQIAQTSNGSPHAYQTFAQCAGCHLKQFEFWRKTPHTRALEVLIAAGQYKNKDCLTCHTVGLGEPGGFKTVGELFQLKNELGSPTTEDLGIFLKAMREASGPKDEIKLVRTGPALPLHQALVQIDHAYSPVQCENCHGAAGEHPFSTEPYKKTVANETCLKCHTAERAPSWYKDGKPNLELISQKRVLVTCPAGDLSP